MELLIFLKSKLSNPILLELQRFIARFDKRSCGKYQRFGLNLGLDWDCLNTHNTQYNLNLKKIRLHTKNN